MWSDKELQTGFAVDHVIPFSFWRRNDLWNLLPSDARVNGKKSDKLPERGLLFERKDAIVFYWEKLRQRHERRFEMELTSFTGERREPGNWQAAAFVRLVEVVEETAKLRGRNGGGHASKTAAAAVCWTATAFAASVTLRPKGITSRGTARFTEKWGESKGHVDQARAICTETR